ncbi:MAG: hypothetical protein WA888_00770 [Burkholderiaceae bacterium]
MIDRLPEVTVGSDPNDDSLLALAQAGQADNLITGDKRALRSLSRYHGTKFRTVRDFATDVFSCSSSVRTM